MIAVDWGNWESITAIVIGGGVITATSWRVLRALFKFEAALPTLFEIAHEFSPNSGKSLRDQIDKLAEGQALMKSTRKVLDAKITEHIDADAVAFQKIDSTLDRIEDHVRKQP